MRFFLLITLSCVLVNSSTGLLMTCDFEDADPECSQDFTIADVGSLGADALWKRWTGPTPTSDTGPSASHPPGQYYLYFEASRQSPGDNALFYTKRLLSPTAPSTQICLMFYYHTYGADLGALNVYATPYVSRLRTENLIFQTSSSVNEWQYGRFVLPNKSYHVVFEAVPGRGYLGDIAIDDITLTNDCPVPTPALEPGQIHHCGFEDDMCETVWTQFYIRKWTRDNIPTPTPNTGPSGDHTTNGTGGYYLYLEANPAPYGEGDMAILKTKYPIKFGNVSCLRFRYHAYGSELGLSVFINNFIQIWNSTENGSEDKWKKVYIDLGNQEGYVQIVGTVGMGTSGDLAIDDIDLFDIPCVNTVGYE